MDDCIAELKGTYIQGEEDPPGVVHQRGGSRSLTLTLQGWHMPLIQVGA
jgi:hypothetical protein